MAKDGERDTYPSMSLGERQAKRAHSPMTKREDHFRCASSASRCALRSKFRALIFASSSLSVVESEGMFCNRVNAIGRPQSYGDIKVHTVLILDSGGKILSLYCVMHARERPAQAHKDALA